MSPPLRLPSSSQIDRRRARTRSSATARKAFAGHPVVVSVKALRLDSASTYRIFQLQRSLYPSVSSNFSNPRSARLFISCRLFFNW